MGYLPVVGKVIIHYGKLDGTNPGFVWNTGYAWRYILIPGSVLGGRTAGIGGTNYTADQVRAMSYEEVCRLFNVPTSGEGWH